MFAIYGTFTVIDTIVTEYGQFSIEREAIVEQLNHSAVAESIII